MESKKILIVDDSRSTRRVLEGVLRKAKFFNILLASTGEEAITICEREHPDLVLLDLIMPDQSGMDVLRKIGQSAKVIIVSGVGQDPIIETAKKLGAVDYIVKPIDEEKVLKVIRHHLA